MTVRGYFVTGTDTGVGKTCVSSALLLKLNQQGKKAAGMKPVASGCDKTPDGLRNADAESLIKYSGIKLNYADVNPYAFEAAIAPHLAAEKMGESISLDIILAAYEQLSRQVNCVVVEGVGGWQVPLSHNETMEDLAIRMNLPVIMVVGIRLGCINHALLTYQAIKASGLECCAWIANQIDPQMSCMEENITAIHDRLDIPCWGVIPWGSDVSAESIVDKLIQPPI